MSTRNGKPLTNLPKGDKRRLSDGRNAWRKMTPEQRREFLDWMKSEALPVADRLYELVRLVRSWLEERTGETPTPHQVAQCLAGAYGIISGLGEVNDTECASIQDMAAKLSANWKVRTH